MLVIQYRFYANFEAFTTVMIEVEVFWVGTPCCVVLCCVVLCCVVVGYYQNTTRRHNPEDLDSNQHRF
jgi:hypothetical protein